MKAIKYWNTEREIKTLNQILDQIQKIEDAQKAVKAENTQTQFTPKDESKTPS